MNAVMMELFLAAIMIPVIIFSMFIPYMTRRTESFGVSIPEKIYYRDDLKRLRKKYATITGVIGLIAVSAVPLLHVFLDLSPDTSGVIWSIILFIFLAGSFLVYLKFHFHMKTIKAEEGWFDQKPQRIVVDTKFREEKLIYSNNWFIIPLLITFLTLIITFVFYEQIPEKIPMKYNFGGEVTRYGEKSFRTLLLMPVMQLYLTLLFLFVNMIIAKAKQQLNVEAPEQSRRQNILFRRRWSAFTIIMGTALIILFSFIQFSFIFSISPTVIGIVTLLFTLAVIAGTIILAVTTGQGGSRIKTVTGENGRIINRDDDKYWKLGQFYFNREDPALFLEKRFGVGWTINFARPLAWLIFLAIIALAFAIPFLLG